MRIEKTAFVLKNSKGTENIFTRVIKIDAREQNGLVRFDINNGAAFILVKKAKLGGGKKTKKTKKAKKSKTKSQKKKSKTRKQTGGNSIRNLIVHFLLYYFLFSQIVTIQLSHNEQNYILTQDEFRTQNPTMNPNVQEIFDRVKHVKVTNNTSVSDPELLQLMSLEGEALVQKPPTEAILRNYRTAFVEVKYANNSHTNTLASLLTRMPSLQRSFISIAGAGPHSQGGGYIAFAEWTKIHPEEDYLTIQLLNVTGDNGEYPDERYRNMPDSDELNTLVKGSFQEHIETMMKTNMIKKEETKGLASMVMLNIPVLASALYRRDLFHQDLMADISSSNDAEGLVDDSDERRAGYALPPNTTMGRTSEYDSIVAMTYPPGEKFETEVRARLLTEEGTEKTIPITTRKAEATTNIGDQMHGIIQHSSVSPPFPRSTFLGNRNVLLVNVMPLAEEGDFIPNPDLQFTPKANA